MKRGRGGRTGAVQPSLSLLWPAPRAPGRAGLALLPLVLACYPTTTRPALTPQPTAPVVEIELSIPVATQAVALALHDDSIPVRRTEPKDGWLESEWFDAITLQPTTQRQLGPGVIKVRAWVLPARPNFSAVTLEGVYHVVADPSREDHSLERQLPADHPVAQRLAAVLNKLAVQYGGAVDSTKIVKGDTTKKVKADTTLN